MNHTLRSLINQLPEDERKSVMAERTCFDGNTKAVAEYDRELEGRLMNSVKYLREVAAPKKHDQPDRKRVERLQTK